jgi:uncharacterized glyoxalase superfamily protein PhnB
MVFQTIPIIRIFDEQKAKNFYIDYLGMMINWEHRFDEDSPIYMQVSKDNLILHLSEHSGDCSPGSKVFIIVDDLDSLFEEITATPYRYNRPSIEQTPWGDRCFTVVDPFSNKLLFNASS